MSQPYQSLDRLKARIEYEAADIFDESDNAEKRFDRLLAGSDAVGETDGFVGIEAEARGIIETRLGDATLAAEDGRVETMRTTDDAAMPLVFPIRDVQKVEYKPSIRSDYEVLEPERYDATDHLLVLSYGRRRSSRSRHGFRGNRLTTLTTRATWMDIAEKIRVTYDRGFVEIPPDVLSVQVAIVNRILRNLKTEQNIAAMEPEQISAVTDAEAILTDDIRNRIDQITPLGGATQAF
jgi:hypothetical protein